MITREEFISGLQEIEKDLLVFYERFLKEEKPKIVLEVGSGWGLFSRSVMEWSEAKVITLDKIGGYGLPQFIKHTEGFKDRIERIVEDSHVILPRMEAEWKEKFDVIFVDGDHGQDGAAKDLSQAWPLLKPGGTMMVDDVFHKSNWHCYKHEIGEFNFGVTRALWGFIQAKREEFEFAPKIIAVAHGVVVIKKIYA